MSKKKLKSKMAEGKKKEKPARYSEFKLFDLTNEFKGS